MKRTAAPALAVLFGAAGFWLGEGASPPWAGVPVLAGVIGCLAVALAVPGKPWRKVLGGFGSAALYAAALVAGSLSFTRAFNECVKGGEAVRVRLSDHYQNNHHYPERLNQLQGFVPCRRITRPTLLEYARTKDGYVLSFRDRLIEHTATESEPFLANK
jgi:hypothetical protein